ncbi:protein ABHD18-like isoform X1 [Watersipora subatra]|uniref:protein ABHD18-like isoform X1 n=1 Tax=Watersipora subatra TaxID=2589382 RepID=UPI00355C77C0
MAGGAVSRFDVIYRHLLKTRFFSKGWGSPENMKRLLEFRHVLSCREKCMELVAKNHPVNIDKSYESGDCRIIEGHFHSPFDEILPGIMPEVTRTARFQMLLPLKWTRKLKPVCVNLAGTGDHGFALRRTRMSRPLVQEAEIGSIILENPFYGCRKPKEQMRSSLQNVTDLFVMGGALVMESIVLFHWCNRMGLGPLGITGVSMGGHMASLAASSWPHPLSFVPCLSWSTASMVWTQGVLTGAVSWEKLQQQYFEDPELYESQLRPLINSPEQHRYRQHVELMKELDPVCSESLDETSRVKIDSQGTATSQPFYSSMMQSIRSRLNDNSLAENRERLKKLQIHSPNLPNKPIQAEVIDFMRGVMDQCTHLSHFEGPVDPSLTIVVTATQDAYMPRDRVISLSELWPGCEVRYVDRGHVAAVVLDQKMFRKAIIDSFERQISMYYSDDNSVAGTSV